MSSQGLSCAIFEREEEMETIYEQGQQLVEVIMYLTFFIVVMLSLGISQKKQVGAAC